jgi:NosR/NirI family nitrous oxide reductase transcriptional regulator
MRWLLMILAALCCLRALPGAAGPLSPEDLSARILPPYALGEAVNDKGVYSLLNSGRDVVGYVFETAPLAPLPGFSGAPIDLLVLLDLEGRFIDVQLVEHNEPIFVSGLGEAPLRKFLEQYRGLSIHAPMVVGVPYGAGAEGNGISYLDGVSKATASVRIAHESILAAALAVAREKMAGVSAGPPARPDPAVDEALNWQALVDQGLAGHLVVTNAQLEDSFKGAIWAGDDPVAAEDPQGIYLDLWLVDIGPPSIARAVLDAESLRDLERFLAVSPDDEPFLVIDAGRHGLVSADFVRNTSPDLLGASQDGLPVALRDADLLFQTLPGVPEGKAMILRTDRRLGFDPARPWVLEVTALRSHGMFQPEIGSAVFRLEHQSPGRFFTRPDVPQPLPAWLEALRARAGDLAVLAVALAGLGLLLGPGMGRFAGLKGFRSARLGLLLAMAGFVGFWGQGQLSIVTPLATLRALLQGGGLAFLLFDAFSLLVWIAAGIGFLIWGRGFFCGWLCPYGALQEAAFRLGRLLRLPEWELPERWNRRLLAVKYAVLAGLVAVVFVAPGQVETAVEVEPFKTAITTGFQREWGFTLYAVLWLALGMVTFKSYCRYLCPLGAFMALGGRLRLRDWIARRLECGSPCQLCRMKCAYAAIQPTGKIQYDECFQCLDCVTIHNDPKQCVPLVLAAKGRVLRPASGAGKEALA